MFPRLLLLFLAVPLVELFCFLVIGRELGIATTFAIIFLTGILGAALARSQGLKALARYREAMAAGRLPHEEVIEGLLVLLAGILLLAPGFFTDTVGFLLLVPTLRRLVRRRLGKALGDRIRVVVPGSGGAPPPRPGGFGRDGVINVEAEVVESHPHRDGPARG